MITLLNYTVCNINLKYLLSKNLDFYVGSWHNFESNSLK